MIYELAFLEPALKEWQERDRNIRDQFKKQLAERLGNRHVPAAELSGAANRYKIKLRSIGYRLVYEVRDEQLVVIAVAIGKRERNAVYKTAGNR